MARHAEDKPLGALGVQKQIATRLVAEGADAWAAVEPNVRQIDVILECKKCRHAHVLVREHVAAGLVLPIGRDGMSVGREANEQGEILRGRAGWFDLVHPANTDTRKRLTCQACGYTGPPNVSWA
jgi:hypothetical protein